MTHANETSEFLCFFTDTTLTNNIGYYGAPLQQGISVSFVFQQYKDYVLGSF